MSIELLSPEQKQAIYAIEDGDSIFVTGSAGTGKSFLLQYLRRNYLGAGLHITASTGIAAVNIGGQTLHSWSGIGLGNMPLEATIQNLFSAKFSRIRKRIKNAKMLAIDEVSMISAATFDLLDGVFKAVRNNDKPFGGLQMILFGDFLQLPPVERGNEINFCFCSQAWKNLNPRTFILKKVFRQQDQKFVNLLDNIRFGNINEADIELLKSRFNLTDSNAAIRPTMLVSHNAQVELINREELKKISETSKFFMAEFVGDAMKFDFLRKNCLAYEKLELKIGSQVMMLKNTYQKDGIINGSLGIVRGFSDKKGHPIVEFQNGQKITITPEEWALEKFDEEIGGMKTEAQMIQIPLILSWAITIHKSQGMTLDKVRCDLSKVFADGQIYVALSRVKTIEGLYIDGLDFRRIKANQDVVEFYKNNN
jgi:ATP-dependent DNA helicase PIF1